MCGKPQSKCICRLLTAGMIFATRTKRSCSKVMTNDVHKLHHPAHAGKLAGLCVYPRAMSIETSLKLTPMHVACAGWNLEEGTRKPCCHGHLLLTSIGTSEVATAATPPRPGQATSEWDSRPLKKHACHTKKNTTGQGSPFLLAFCDYTPDRHIAPATNARPAL